MGPGPIAHLLGLNPATVHRVLARCQLNRLAWMDRATARVIRRYERATRGELVHVDVKKLGDTPDSDGHKALGRDQDSKRRSGAGYAFIHTPSVTTPVGLLEDPAG